MEPFLAFSQVQAQLARISAVRDAIIPSAITELQHRSAAVVTDARRYHDMIDRVTRPLAIWHALRPPVRIAPRTPRVRNFRDLPSIRGDWTN